ncbi:MAG: hypothetical protein M1339_06680, partial [Bacteroidetes bacterium]|nr:hypothetical protein [Bacteroidota bacterium]
VDGFAPVGLIDKYNAPGTIDGWKRNGNIVTVRIGESGPFAAYSASRPRLVRVNGSNVRFDYADNVISVNIEGRLEAPVIQIVF